MVEVLFPLDSAKVLDLLDFKTYPYSYSGQYPADDQFMQLMQAVLQHSQVFFYWYAMSGIMRLFFDRLTDIVTIEKDTGRQFAGKEVFVIAVGSDEELPSGFETPFQMTSEYFEMKYNTCYYRPKKAVYVHTDKRKTFFKSCQHHNK